LGIILKKYCVPGSKYGNYSSNRRKVISRDVSLYVFAYANTGLLRVYLIQVIF